MIALTRILVPTNLGEPSKAAVTYGVEIARRFGAKLFLLRVLPAKEFDAVVEAERVVAELIPGESRHAPPTADELVRNVACTSLSRLLDRLEEQDTRAEYLLRAVGSHGPHFEIAACAREYNIELIIMGKHRIGHLDHLLAGSVTEKVVREAPCPVLVVHHPEHEFVLPDDLAGSAAP